MAEKKFVDELLTTIRDGFHGAIAVRPSDNFTLGIPDILAWIPVDQAGIGNGPPTVWALAIEAKQVRPLLKDPFDPGRRTAPILQHPFTGPQISMLRKMKDAGIEAFGLVRASDDTAFRVEPESIPAKTGNFTHEELVEFGHVTRRVDGRWQFWEKTYDRVPSPGHRDHP